MKKVLLSLVTATLVSTGAMAQCTIDQSNTAFFNPSADSVPCATRGIPYDETLQMYIPSSVNLQDYVPSLPIAFNLNIDSVVLNNITGLPTGLSWSSNPNTNVFYGGTNLCGKTQGTTNDPAGVYPIVFDGLIYVSGQAFPGFFDGDTSFTIQQLLQANQGQPTFDLRVIEQGEQCQFGPVSVRNFNADLNAMIGIMPNPSNGIFTVKIDAANRVNGEMVITDVTGKQVYTQAIDVLGNFATTINLRDLPAGLYTLQVRTANGFAAKSISIE